MSKLLLFNSIITLLNFFLLLLSGNDGFIVVTCIIPLLTFIAVKIDRL